MAGALNNVARAIREQTRVLKDRPCLHDSTLDPDKSLDGGGG